MATVRCGRLLALEVAHYGRQPGDAALEAFPCILFRRDEKSVALAFDPGGLAGEAEFFRQPDRLAVAAGENPDAVDGGGLYVYTLPYTLPACGQARRGMLADPAAPTRFAGASPNFAQPPINFGEWPIKCAAATQ